MFFRNGCCEKAVGFTASSPTMEGLQRAERGEHGGILLGFKPKDGIRLQTKESSISWVGSGTVRMSRLDGVVDTESRRLRRNGIDPAPQLKDESTSNIFRCVTLGLFLRLTFCMTKSLVWRRRGCRVGFHLAERGDILSIDTVLKSFRQGS